MKPEAGLGRNIPILAGKVGRVGIGEIAVVNLMSPTHSPPVIEPRDDRAESL